MPFGVLGFFTSTGIKTMQPRIHDKIGYNLIHTFTCNKLSERAEGQLHYQLWQHSEDQSFGIALSKNESTGGFSAELIKVDDIIQLLGKLYQEGKSCLHRMHFASLKLKTLTYWHYLHDIIREIGVMCVKKIENPMKRLC